MEQLTTKEFRLWLVRNDYTQNSLAKKLGISANTITTYVKNERFPVVFILALSGLEKHQIIQNDNELKNKSKD